MWRSIVTCVPVQVKPISKRSQYAIEDLQALQQDQVLHDATGYHRQVLPNIRPIPKSKFVYKGLAYKEVKKIPGIIHNNRGDQTPELYTKPLVDYNLAQAYVRYEVNAERTKQVSRNHPPPSTVTAVTAVTTSSTTGTSSKLHTKDQQLTKTQTSLDLREMRKRIVRGTTLNVRAAPQSASWTPGRSDNKSTLGSEVLLPTRSFSTLNHAPIVPQSPPLLPSSSPIPKQNILNTTPTLSQHFDTPPINNIKTISLL